MEIGGVYRVNHHHYLPEKLPTQLEQIRAVMVDKVTKTTVSVSYPSEKSMENFFGGDVDAYKIPPTTGLMQPNLDRSCVMTPDLARKVLRDRIPFEEFATRRGERRFWMVSVENANTDSASGKRMMDGEVVVRGGCVKKDNSNVLAAEWGARKRASFTGKQRSDKGSSTVIMSGSSSRMQVSFSGGDVEKLGLEKWEEEVEEKVEEEKAERRMSRKRKKPCEAGKLKQQQIVKKRKKKTMKKQKAPVEINNSTDCNNNEDPKLRWSEQRYKLAERNILKIMKEKGAVYGNPVVRAELRTEARKMIGDTGLLDHLLKHMAGKLAPGGKERFRRRHNPDGIMEYWIESAELVDIRKQAGVEDPYWTPPKGWVKGDPITMDAGCAAEIKRLRDDMEKLRREFVEVARAEAGRRREMVVREERGLDHHGAKNLKAKQEELLRRKAEIEEQLHNVSKALDEMQEDVDTLMREAAETKSNKSSRIINSSTRVVVVAATSAGVIKEPDDHNGYCGTEAIEIKEDDKGNTKEQAAGERPKSAFRICKPEGAFLWPGDMAAAAATLSAVPPSSSTSSQVVIQVAPEDVLFAASSSPLSVSSSTSSTMGPAPLLQSAPPPLAPAGVIKPVAKRAAVILEKEEAGCNAKNGNGTSPTATASSVNRTAVPDYVPDLNEIPLDAYLQPYQNLTRQAIPPSPPVAVPNYSTYTTVPTSLSQSAGGWSFLPPLASPSSSVPSIIRRRLQHSGNQVVLTIKPPSSSAENNTFMFPVPN